jgi:orotate phosphoribosyltransferase
MTIPFFIIKLNIATSVINRNSLQEKLKQQNYSVTTITTITELLSIIEDKMYNPLSTKSNTKEDILNKAKAIIEAID